MTSTSHVVPRSAGPGVRGYLGPMRVFARSGAIVFASTLAWHASNFLFNGVTARLLGPSGYGELAATISLLYVATPLLVSIQTVACASATERALTGRTHEIRLLLRANRTRLAAAAGTVAVAAALVSSGAARFLRLHSGLPIAIVGVGLGLAIVTHCQRGVLQGTREFGRYATSTLVEASTKIVAAVVAVSLVSSTAASAAVAIPASAACGLIANTRLLRFLPRGERDVRPARSVAAVRPGATVATFVLLAFLLAADVVAAKRYLPPHAAGVYAAVSLAGKAVYFTTSALSLLLFPLFTEQRVRNVRGRAQLAGGAGAVAGVSLLLAGLYFAEPNLLVKAFVGGRYAQAAPYLGWIALAFGAYALMYLAALYLLARGSSVGTTVLGFTAFAQLSALYVWHSSVGAIVAVQCAVLAGGAAAVLTAALRHVGEADR